MTADPDLESMLDRITARTGRTRLEVLAVLGDHLDRLRISPSNITVIAALAETRANVTAAIDRELGRGG